LKAGEAVTGVPAASSTKATETASVSTASSAKAGEATSVSAAPEEAELEDGRDVPETNRISTNFKNRFRSDLKKGANIVKVRCLLFAVGLHTSIPYIP
jgi:hypothetical protein